MNEAIIRRPELQAIEQHAPGARFQDLKNGSRTEASIASQGEGSEDVKCKIRFGSQVLDVAGVGGGGLACRGGFNPVSEEPEGVDGGPYVPRFRRS